MNKLSFVLSSFLFTTSLFSAIPGDVYPATMQVIDGVVWRTVGWNGSTSDIRGDTCGKPVSAYFTGFYIQHDIYEIEPDYCAVSYSIWNSTDEVPPPVNCTDDEYLAVDGLCHNLSENPYECTKRGRYPTGHPVGFGSVFGSNFSMKWERECLTRDQAINGTLPLIAGITGNISGKPDLLGNLLDKGVKKLKDLWGKAFSEGKPITNDYLLSLPKYNPNTKVYEAEIIEAPIPKGSDGLTPSRSPVIESDPYQTFLRDEYFPSNNLGPDGLPKVNMADVDNFNTANQIFKDNGTDPITYTYTPNTSNIWKSTMGAPSTRPVYDVPQMVTSSASFTPKVTYESPIFRVAPPDSTFYPPVPVKVADVPLNQTVQNTSLAGTPVKQWTNTLHYPDGSSAREVISIDETNKRGVRTTTTISPDGTSNTTSESFYLPNYVPNSTAQNNFDVVKDAPVTNTTGSLSMTTPSTSPTINPVTGLPFETNSFPNISNSPKTMTGDDIINASMPSYSFPDLVEFVPFDVVPVNNMISETSELFGNIHTQLTAIKTTFDDTKGLLNGSWTPPVIPSGACGDSLVLHWHGKDVDLCPPMLETTSQFSPIVTPLVTLGGMALSIVIFIGGF